jgi:hypothetical protein
LSTTTFINGITLTDDDWFNDVDAVVYDILGSPTTVAGAKDALFPAWTTPSFSAGNFTASGSMTWTVAAGDVGTYAYVLSGKMMTVSFSINTSTVGGSLSNTLQIAIPASKTATKSMSNPIRLLDNNVVTDAFCRVSASSTIIEIYRSDLGNYTASTDQTNVSGQITFEIN